MSQYDDRMEAPPPGEVARRFSEPLAAAIDAYNVEPDDDLREIRAALGEAACGDLSSERIDGVIGERRGRIVALLAELDTEFRMLGEDLGFRKWRAQPTMARYSRGHLAVSYSRLRSTQKPANLLADLREVACSPTGSFNRDAHLARRPLTIDDFAKRPRVRLPEYSPGVEGHESPDRRVVGGREAA